MYNRGVRICSRGVEVRLMGRLYFGQGVLASQPHRPARQSSQRCNIRSLVMGDC